MSTLILDIETIPCAAACDAWDTIAELAARREETPEKYAATTPALARPVLVGMMNPATGGRCVVYDSSLLDLDPAAIAPVRAVAADGEAAVLAETHGLLRGVKRLVTFNGRGFDVPALLLRSMAYGLEPAAVLTRAVNQKPWESGAHVDLMHVLSFGGATGRHALAAYAIGLCGTNPKAGGDGTDVAELVARRDGLALATYCLGDVECAAALARAAGVDLPAASAAA